MVENQCLAGEKREVLLVKHIFTVACVCCCKIRQPFKYVTIRDLQRAKSNDQCRHLALPVESGVKRCPHRESLKISYRGSRMVFPPKEIRKEEVEQ